MSAHPHVMLVGFPGSGQSNLVVITDCAAVVLISGDNSIITFLKSNAVEELSPVLVLALALALVADAFALALVADALALAFHAEIVEGHLKVWIHTALALALVHD